MGDDEFRALASRIKRRIWGIRVARVSDSHRDFYWGQRQSIRDRLFDRFEPFIIIGGSILITLVITPIIALIAIAL